jgi:hypothetical protein
MHGEENCETRLMRNIEDKRLITAWQQKHGLGAGVASDIGLRPGDSAEARDYVALKKD